MNNKTKIIVLGAVFAVIVGLTFALGIMNNPGFSIFDFCAGLSTEIIGWILAATIFQVYYDQKLAARRGRAGEDRPPSTADEIIKLKALLDSGAITPEEYQQAKGQLLGK